MLSDRYIYNGKSIIKLNNYQIKAKEDVLVKIKDSMYLFEHVNCFCESQDFYLLAKKDRFGLPVDTVICKKCGLLLTNPRMTRKSYDEFYDMEYRRLYVGEQDLIEEFFEEEVKVGRLIINFISQKILINYQSVLEIGCGAGGILLPFMESGCEIMGIDLGSQYVSYGSNQGLNLKNVSTQELLTDFKGYFDVIILNHVLEHFLNLKDELSTVWDLLKPGGVVYIAVPGVKNLIRSYNCDFLQFLQNAHTFHFCLGTLEQVMNECSFELLYGNEDIKSLFRKVEKNKYRQKHNYYMELLNFLTALENDRFNFQLNLKCPYELNYNDKQEICEGFYNCQHRCSRIIK